MSEQPPTIPTMVIAVPVFILVSLARIFAWPKSRLLTVAMLITSAAYIFGMPVVDRAIDQHQVFGFANVSDLAHAVLMSAAWWAVGLVWLRIIRRHLHKSGPYHPYRTAPQGRYARAVRAWTWWIAAAAGAMVLSWYLGQVSQREVIDAFALHDPASAGFGASYLTMLAVTSLLAISASAIAWRTQGAPQVWLAVMAASAICGLGYAITCSVLLVADRASLARNHALIAQGWSVPGILLFAGAGGVILFYPRKQQA